MMARLRRTSTVVGCTILAACGALTDSEETLPPGTQGPEWAHTPDGAISAYNAVRADFREAFDAVVLTAAMLTDEFGSNRYGEPVLGQPEGLDRRHLPNDIVEASASRYILLHQVRGGASEAIGLLATYAPDLPSALRGHTYALAGYAEVFLADLYCSGIPLSTVDFAGDYTLRPGSATADVYAHAVALFDTAVTLAADSARILHLAQVGRGRALLALGRYTEAAQSVSSVPDAFRYEVEYGGSRPSFVAQQFDFASTHGEEIGATVADGDGGGLPYRTSGQPGGDPRVAVEAAVDDTNQWGFRNWRPTKYPVDGIHPITVASGTEARLIEAEAALEAADVGSWLAKVNQVRRMNVPLIADTTDPVSQPARVDLMFRERAYSLFVTGHRQGDLRRLIREYRLDQAVAYPSGLYPANQGSYGSDVTLPVPPSERDANPLYTGCIGRGA